MPRIYTLIEEDGEYFITDKPEGKTLRGNIRFHASNVRQIGEPREFRTEIEGHHMFFRQSRVNGVQ